MKKYWVYGADATEEEWFRLNEKLKARGWGPFQKETTRVYFNLTDEGRLVGFGAVQFIAHAEPLWVDPEYRGTGLANEIADEVVGFLVKSGIGFVATAGNDFSKQLCERHGMTLVDKPTYVRKAA